MKRVPANSAAISNVINICSLQETHLLKLTDVESRVLFPDHIGWWESFIAVLVIVQVVYLPYVLAFDYDGGETLFYVELLVDILFCLDMILQFNVAYSIEDASTGEEEQSEFEKRLEQDEIQHLETRRKKIAVNYLQGWFSIDFLAIVPLFVTSQDGLSLTKTLRLPRLFRLLKVAKVFRALRSNSKLRRFLLYSKYTSAFR